LRRQLSLEPGLIERTQPRGGKDSIGKERKRRSSRATRRTI